MRQQILYYNFKNINNKDNNKKGPIKILENKNKKATSNLNNSFSKEFTNLSEDLYEDDDDNNLLAQSYSHNQINKYREQVLKEPLTIILDSYISFNEKNNKKRKIKFITPKDISKLNNKFLTKQFDENKVKEQYLKIKNNVQDYNQFNEIFKDYLNEKDIQDFYKFIINVKYKLNTFNPINNISPIFTLEHLFNEILYNNQLRNIKNRYYLKEKYNKLKPIIYKYRQIKGDGNCYYRAVMFRYIEQIILNENVILLKKIILDMNKCFYSKEIQSRLYIKIDTNFKPVLHLKIMILILRLLEGKKIQEAHQLFVKCILSCAIYDYGLILYFRYIIYLYIKDNENKLFSTIFPVKIGNLLPSAYENEKGEFEFDKFYTNYLLKMFTEAEKIIIYLTPFVLGINLDIIIFEDNEDQIVKRFSFDEKNYENKEQNNVITLLYRNSHYELVYTTEQYNKYSNIFKFYDNYNKSNNNVEKFYDSEFFLLQDNKKENNTFENNETNNLKNTNNSIKSNKNNIKNNNNNIVESNNNNTTNNIKEINLGNKKQIHIKNNNLINKDNNVSYIDSNNIKDKDPIKDTKDKEMEIELEIDTPIGHPECEENNNYLDEIDNMFNVKNINCLKCKKNIKEIINDKFTLCEHCLKNEILTQLKESYSKYLINDINLQNKFKIKDIIICNYSLYLKDILDILKFKDELFLVKYLRQFVCLKCYKITEDKNEKMIDFPCGCCICNKEEFENYFTVEKEISDNYQCICGYKFTPKDLYYLTIQCNKVGCDLIILFIINIFNKSILSKGCCICGEDKKRLQIKYEPENSIFCFENYLKLKRININLDHFMCIQCKNKFENQQFLCYYCDRIHLCITDKEQK